MTIAAFVFVFVYYFVVARRFAKPFVHQGTICLIVGIILAFFWFRKASTLRELEARGTISEALVWQKVQKKDYWQVDVVIKGFNYDLNIRPCDPDISAVELQALQPQQTTQVRYLVEAPNAYIEASFQRQLKTLQYSLLGLGLMLFLGVLCLIWGVIFTKKRVKA
jgi:hypothetical protein